MLTLTLIDGNAIAFILPNTDLVLHRGRYYGTLHTHTRVSIEDTASS